MEFDFSGATKHRDKVVKTLTGGVSMLFEKNKIDLIEGFGSVTDDGNVKVGGSFDGNEIEAGTVILACGSIPPPVGGMQFGGRILDTAGMWLTAEQPKRLAVIGAGASGTEVASAFGRLGTDVILLEALDQILPLEEKEIARACAKEIAKQNVNIVTGASVEKVEDTGDAVKIEVGGETHEVDLVCIAAGRGADVEGLGLEDAGVETDERGLIKVDGAMKTTKRGRLGDRRHGARPRARPQGLRRGHHRRRVRRRDGHPPDRLRLHPARDLLLTPGGVVRAHRGPGQGGRARGGDRQGADGRRRAPPPSTATAAAW